MRKRYCPFLWLIVIGLTATPAWSGPDDGILGIYYDSYHFDANPTLTRIDPSIDFDWGENPPDPTMRNSQFCVRWLGELEVPSTEAYTFVLRADGNAGLWIDDRPIIDRAWRGMTPVEKEAMIDLVAGRVYPIAVEYEASGFGAAIQLSWQSPSLAPQIIPPGGLRLPLRARDPSPATETAEIVQHPTLRWKAGYRAIHHDVYFGRDANAVATATPASAGIYRGRQPLDETEFDPGPLDWNTTYYWRVDEVNEAHPDSPWKGPVWQFTTADFLLVDDFESYTDEEGERLYEFWIDGWYEENGTGSIVGYYMTDQFPVVHGGRESMPFEYNNVSVPYYSEAYRTWDTPQDWTGHGLTHLSLWLRGNPASFIEDPNGRIIVNGYGGYTTGTADPYSIVCKQLVGNGEIVARIDSLSNAKGWARAGVIIYDTQAHMLQYAAMTVTAEYGSSFVYRAGGKTSTARITTAGIQTPHWVKLTRTGNVLTAQHSTDGQTWLDLTDEKGKPVAVTIAMPANVSIGLYVVGDRWDKLVTAEFSAAATAGDVRGPWQATYGGLNSRDDLYVALEDAAGRLAVSVHPDPGALNFTEWTQWRIPLSDFAAAGVDVTAVRTMYIGMGNRDHPQPNGSGQIHIDDIHVIKAPPEPIIVDDFESYNDDDNRIYDTWIDGLTTGTNGSLVGYTTTGEVPPPLHGGLYALPFSYDNAATPYYSEVYRAWNEPQDWTVRGLTHVSLWVKGRPTPLSVESDGHVVLGIPGGYAFTAPRFGYKQATGDCGIVAKIQDLKGSGSVIQAGIIIRETPDWNSRYVVVGVAPKHALSVEHQLVERTPPVQDVSREVLPPHWIGLRRAGDVFTAHRSADGVIWEPVVDAQSDPVIVNVAMRQTVCIGVYMLGRTWEGNSTAKFSGVAFSGDVSESWQVTDPDWGNSPDSFYVALEDAAGKAAMAIHPDPTLVNAIDWTHWSIPLADFAKSGVDVTAIQRMYIGVGDRDNPQPSGTGMIHIDDIRVLPAGPLQLPLIAAGPYPPNGAVDVPQSPLLTWQAGEAATHHDIYFGDDANAVASATTADAAYRGRLKAPEAAFDPGLCKWGKTYFWRVDEVNEADPNNSWKGKVWRFTTADFLVIDDFESYSDEEGNRIYEYWIDALATRWSGAFARIPSGPYAERTIVHGGRQSMPFDYNNVYTPWFSEIERVFDTAQNWRVNGVDTLVLYVHGQTTNAPAPLFMMVRDAAGKTSTVAHSDAEVTRSTEWIEWRIPLSQFAGVNATRVRRLTLGVGDRAKPAPGGAGRIYIDDIRAIRGGETQ